MKNVLRFPRVDGSLGWYECSPIRDKIKYITFSAEKDYDVAVVGAGFTGLSAAARLVELDPSLRVIVIDALKIGQGTSGRNAGFIIDLPHNLDSGTENLARDKQIQALNCFSIERLKAAAEPYEKEVAWKQAGKYLVAHEKKHIKHLNAFESLLKKIDAPYEVFQDKHLAERLGTSYYLQGIYTPYNILMNPSALSQALALSIEEKVDLLAQSPVRKIEKKKKWELTVDQGVVRADKVLLAVNSHTEEFGVSQNRLAPVFTYASLTRVLTEQELVAFKSVQEWGLTSAHPAGTTARFTADKRIFIRNTFDFLKELVSTDELIASAQKQHIASFHARFPKLTHVPFEYTWGGMLCMTMNHQSSFLEKEEGLFAIAGCNGVGVAKGTYLGAYMADYMLGRQSKELDFILANASPSWIAPEPLRSLGAKIRFAYEERQAKGEI